MRPCDMRKRTAAVFAVTIRWRMCRGRWEIFPPWIWVNTDIVWVPQLKLLYQLSFTDRWACSGVPYLKLLDQLSFHKDIWALSKEFCLCIPTYACWLCLQYIDHCNIRVQKFVMWPWCLSHVERKDGGGRQQKAVLPQASPFPLASLLASYSLMQSVSQSPWLRA